MSRALSALYLQQAVPAARVLKRMAIVDQVEGQLESAHKKLETERRKLEEQTREHRLKAAVEGKTVRGGVFRGGHSIRRLDCGAVA